VVGPSGSGKDAVLQRVRALLASDPRFVFPRRIVTRASSRAEDHHSMTAAEFEASLQRNAFALHWQAHALCYGIPADIDDEVRFGKCVVFNASRGIAKITRARYVNTSIVLVDAPISTRAERLAARAREHPEEIMTRLQRQSVEGCDPDLTIDNTGMLEAAADQLVGFLLARVTALQRIGIDEGSPRHLPCAPGGGSWSGTFRRHARGGD
jgi:ribose 1,5-bisphosphokinase